MMIPYTENSWTDGSSHISAATLAVIEQGIKDGHNRPAVRATGPPPAYANSTWTPVPLTSESFDTVSDYSQSGNQHDNATNNTRFTAQYAGKYLMSLHTAISDTNVTLYVYGSGIRVNGGTFIANKLRNSAQPYVIGTAPNFIYLGLPNWTLTTIYALAAGDYVEAMVFGDSGANFTCELSMARIA